MDEEKEDEIIIGVNIPKEPKKKKEKKNINKKIKEVVNKTTASKEKKSKTKARISGDSTIFRNRLIRRIILIVLVIIAIIIFLASDFFNIKEIIVENNEFVSKEEIISLSQISNDKNIFEINKNIIKNNIKQNSYIENITIKRKFPNKLVLNIEERKVKYMIQLGEAYIYINNQGYMLDISNEKKDKPILLGIKTDVSQFKKGNRLISVDLKKLDIVNRIYEVSNNNEILALISKIDISDSKNYTLYLESEKKTVYLGDCSDLNTRILYVKAILEQESGIAGEIFVNVDLNEDNVFFREKI